MEYFMDKTIILSSNLNDKIWMICAGIIITLFGMINYLNTDYNLINVILCGLTIMLLKYFELYRVEYFLLTLFLNFIFGLIYKNIQLEKILEPELNKLQTSICNFKKLTLVLEIINSGNTIDSKFFINYFQPIILYDKAIFEKFINEIEIPNDLKFQNRNDIYIFISKIYDFIFTKHIITIETIHIYPYNYAPTNSLILFYIKLLIIKESVINNNKNITDIIKIFKEKFYRLNNTFDIYELIRFYTIFDKHYIYIENPNLLNGMIYSLERYFLIYQKHNKNNFF